MDSEKKLPALNDVEIRILGSLIEKRKTTPDYYPMTLNGLTVACNQKTSRKPVVDYDEATVMQGLNSLKAKSLVSTAVGGSIRSVKYKHNFTTVYPISQGELALLCVMFLRGPQTHGELHTNSERLYEFGSLEEIHDALKTLMDAAEPFVTELAKRPGQKEPRFMHLLGEHLNEDTNDLFEELKHVTPHALEARLAAVEYELGEVKATLSKLTKELLG